MKNDSKKVIKKKLISDELESELAEIERKDFWFEKFKWFITSEGYLVIR